MPVILALMCSFNSLGMRFGCMHLAFKCPQKVVGQREVRRPGWTDNVTNNMKKCIWETWVSNNQLVHGLCGLWHCLTDTTDHH